MLGSRQTEAVQSAGVVGTLRKPLPETSPRWSTRFAGTPCAALRKIGGVPGLPRHLRTRGDVPTPAVGCPRGHASSACLRRPHHPGAGVASQSRDGACLLLLPANARTPLAGATRDGCALACGRPLFPPLSALRVHRRRLDVPPSGG